MFLKLRLFEEYRPRFICSQENAPPDHGGGGPSSAPPPPAPPAPPRAVADPSAEVSRLQGEIANVRAEAAAHRVNERTAKEQVAVAEARIAELTTESTRREEAARAEGVTAANTWKGRAMEAELKAAALSAGLVDVDLLPLIKREGIVTAADGSITGIPEAIAAFKAAKPTYFREGAPAPAARATGSNTPPPTPNQAPPQSSVKGKPRADYDAQKKAAHNSLRGL
jgi:hypothetical protein